MDKELYRETPGSGEETSCCLASGYPVFSSKDETLGVGSVGVDITDRERAEEAQAHLAAIVESASDAIICATLEGVITDWNPAAEQLFGYAADDTVGRSIAMLFALPDQERVLALLRAAQEQQRGAHYDVTGMRRDATRLDLSISVSPIWDRSGHASGAALIGRDLTERHAVERLREQFLTLAAHELKTPLTVVRGSSQLLLRRIERGLPLDERHRELLEDVERQTSSMSRLIDEVLDLSRIEAGRLALHLEPTDVADLVRHAVRQQRLLHPDRTFEPEGANAPVEGKWDRGRLEQVLTNLLDNAVKYSPPDRPVTVRLHTTNDTVVIAVADRGIGVKPAELSRLFERHFRGSNVGLVPAGLGLGLYLADEIVQRHGGRIRVESEPGEGSVFVVELPRTVPLEEAA